MPSLPNPFDPAASDAAAGQAAASFPSPLAHDAAADLSDSGDTDCPSDEAAATPRQSDLAAADICDIGEIFVGARKLDALNAEYLFDLDAGKHRHPNPRLDVASFMQELDEAPLFLRQAVG